MSERFFLSQPLQAGLVVLDGPEAHHLRTVCRLKAGDAVRLFNGDGREYQARIESVDRREVALAVSAPTAGDTPARELAYTLELAAPLPKGDRAQFLIEKLTELGLTTFVPLKCQRSIVHPSENRREKLHRYVVEACKQSGRNVLMEIAPLAAWGDYVASPAGASCSILAHPYSIHQGADSPPSLRTILEHAATGQHIRIAIGPEGGFTEEEAGRAIAAGWIPANLGPRILRIETAAVFLASAVVANHG